MNYCEIGREFQANGFAVLDGLVGDDVLCRLDRAAQQLSDIASGRTQSDDRFILEAPAVGAWVAWQQGDRAFPGVLRSVNAAHDYAPDLADVAHEMSFRSIVEVALGVSTASLRSVFLWAKPAKVGSEKPWHQDMAYAPRGFAENNGDVASIWLALDSATRENGCLEFLPGSHKAGLVTHTGTYELEGHQPRAKNAVEPFVDVGRHFPEKDPVPVPLTPGSAVVFHGLVVHRSCANISDSARRAFSFLYVQH